MCSKILSFVLFDVLFKRVTWLTQDGSVQEAKSVCGLASRLGRGYERVFSKTNADSKHLSIFWGINKFAWNIETATAMRQTVTFFI